MVGKDKGKIGEVKKIIKERNWCFVDGLNQVCRSFIMKYQRTCKWLIIIFATNK